MAVEPQTYTLNDFTADLDRIVRANSNGSVDARAIVTEARPHFARLLQDTSWMEEKYRRPEPHTSTSYMMAKAPDGIWTVTSVVWWPGYSTPIHDHLIWGLIGVHEGIEEESRFKRVDDGSRPNHAELREAGKVFNRPGEISHLIPPTEDIHRIMNPSDRPSLSIHIYGGHLDQVLRHRYNAETGEIMPYRSNYKVMC